MVTKTSLIPLMAVAATMAAAGVASASVVTGTATLTETTSAPTGTVIAANLPGGTISASTNPNYYAGSNTTPLPGEIFTTGSAATSITDIVVNIADPGNAKSTSPLYLYLGTASGTSAFTGTTTYEYTATAPSTGYTKGDYLDFNLAGGFAAAANTQYVYAISTTPSTGGSSGIYLGLGAVTSSGNGTASQGLGLFNASNSTTSPNSPNANDVYNTYNGSTSVTGAGGTDNAVFEVLGSTASAVPLPSTLALTLFGVLGLGLLLKQRKAT